MMIFYHEMKVAFADKSFADLMTLSGQVFRAVESRRTLRFQYEGKGYFIKQHMGVGWKEIIKNLLQGRLPVISAKNEWFALQHLQALQVSVPSIVGYGCKGWNPAKKQSFLITRELPAHISLEHFCQTWPQNPPSFILKQKIITQVTDITRTMHNHGINHRDLYICHFLLDLTLKNAVRLHLIDLHRAQVRSLVPERWQIKDLAGLYFSSKKIGLTTRDLLRFIKKYRNKPLREIFHRQASFWLKVKQRGDKLYRKHEKQINDE